MTSEHWVVVGAGSAGCVVAARLSESAHRQVTLLDDGPDLRAGAVPPSIDGSNFLDALAEPGRTHPDLMVSRTAGSEPSLYWRGRGIGGSSAVNAMVAFRGGAEQYRRWGWHDADQAWSRVLIPVEQAGIDELGPIDRALLGAHTEAVRAPLTRTGRRRVTAAEAYLWPALERQNLRIRPDTEVDSVTFAGRAASGVRLMDGTTVDADRVVLAAGAIHTPAILLRSGVDTPGVGSNLQDHPSLTLTLQLRSHIDQDLAGLVTGTLLTTTIGDALVQILPMNHLGRDPAAAGLGAVMSALMTPRGRRGEVRLDDDGRPRVGFALLDDASDVSALAAGVRFALGLIDRPAFSDIVDAVYVDDSGTPARVLDDAEALVRWVQTHPGDYVHASGTCAMGTVVDDDGTVVGYTNLSVCDASIFPDIPAANTHLPVTMAAERLCLRGRMAT